MCGIAGFTIPRGLSEADRRSRFEAPLKAMTASLHHRGPDAQRAVLLDAVALGHTRLAIVDLAGGVQPMVDPSTGLTVVFNGEIFNHVELRAELAATYAFRTTSDTEVILAAFLREGIDCVRRFIGQFAFALFDPRDGSLHLARDRIGVRPLFYCRTADGLAFASEAKALFAAELIRPSLDATAIKDCLTLWAPVSGKSLFEGVKQLEAGHVGCFREGRLTTRRYWELDLTADRVDHCLSFAQATEQVRAAVDDAVRLRLRADVPVAAYLSGGLDSSLICALAQRRLGGTLQTFSVAFAQARFDERGFQEEVARALGTEHHVVEAGDADIGQLLPEVVRLGEQVLLRTAPAPFLALSALVRRHGTKVVLTGEGSDEIFLGYDLFKETALRAFWGRRPQSTGRPALFRRLYPYLQLSQQSVEVLRQVYGAGLDAPEALDFSHQLRFGAAGRIGRFFSADFDGRVKGYEPVAALAATLPAAVKGLPPLRRAQALEVSTLLSGYLLSAQGDRVMMGSSIEGRFPFLDHRVIELSARLPDHFKLRALHEKRVLKSVAAGLVPSVIQQRSKLPYRAPAVEALLGRSAPEWSRELFSKRRVEEVGVFDGGKVERLVAKLAGPARGLPPSEADSMAVTAIATTQLLDEAFLRRPVRADPAKVAAVELEVAH